jgi:hypothetical protein
MEKTQKKLMISRNHSSAYEKLINHMYDITHCAKRPHVGLSLDEWDIYRKLVEDELIAFNAKFISDNPSQVPEAVFSFKEDYVHFCLKWG